MDDGATPLVDGIGYDLPARVLRGFPIPEFVARLHVGARAGGLAWYFCATMREIRARVSNWKRVTWALLIGGLRDL